MEGEEVVKEFKVQAVCGFGVGSSTLLKMKLDQAFRHHGVAASVFAGDVGSSTSTECDVIFTSRELAEFLTPKAKCPVIVIDSFVNKAEIEAKVLQFVKEYGA